MPLYALMAAGTALRVSLTIIGKARLQELQVLMPLLDGGSPVASQSHDGGQGLGR
ncbi:hypothetical protein VB738_13460 [Cyanobium gracile UHCC 0139]|uniref:Uncharacterized protein n=1 Tax=Cyanobium gracile UHCC 0139 TaxID=3110308 RepID=A0ABU5RWV1_9CYAN|nr:hypothetical protein [Cyanobium gracile]MEA5392265.1 hypothetical protein [Cyanobium gracile UHCC 0139]